MLGLKLNHVSKRGPKWLKCDGKSVLLWLHCWATDQHKLLHILQEHSGPFYWLGLTLIPEGISNYIRRRCSRWICESMSNFINVMGLIKFIHVNKGLHCCVMCQICPRSCITNWFRGKQNGHQIRIYIDKSLVEWTTGSVSFIMKYHHNVYIVNM